jgi:uracil-DNA glycosylase
MNWKEFIDKEKQQDYYKRLTDLVLDDALTHTIYPPHNQVLRALRLTPLNQVTVVILGQDPYHGPNQAHGLAFSVEETCPIPPSLKNIFKEINSDLSTSHKFPHGSLVEWAKQGVLLLNSSLTVRQGEPNSHKSFGWETFTNQIISIVAAEDRPIVFILWGASAREKKKFIHNPKHLILEAAHPSPLSAHNGFFGCKHFSKTNSFLKQNNLEPIDWLKQ